VGLSEEVAAAGEVFQIEELVFFEAMNGFDVALVGVRRRRDAHVLAVAESFGEIAFELAAIVGLPDQIAERDAVAIQVLLDARGEDGAGRGAASFGESPEEQAAADIARGVLNDGQMQPLSLQPVAGNIVEIFGVGADLLKQGPGRLDVGQVLFALVFTAAFFDQAVLMPDAFQSVMADGQIELPNQAAGAEGGQGLAQFDQPRFPGQRRLVRLMAACARLSGQAGRPLLLEAAQPLADGGHRGEEEPRGGLDAALFGALH